MTTRDLRSLAQRVCDAVDGYYDHDGEDRPYELRAELDDLDRDEVYVTKYRVRPDEDIPIDSWTIRVEP